jgi:hypothetical protein
MVMDILVLGSKTSDPIETLAAHHPAPLEFVEGQLIKATVQHVINSLVWLTWGGQTVIARTAVPLQAQQDVSLEVINADPERVTFRLLPEAN